MNLYELSSELALIETELVDAGGELTDELEKRLDACSLGFNAKVENIAKWVLDLEGREEAVDRELARLTARKKAVQNLQRRLKEYTKTCMERVGKTRIEFGAMTVSVYRNPPSVEVRDEKTVPARFITIIPEQHVLDKKALLEALKAGEPVEGAALINDKTHLRVR